MSATSFFATSKRSSCDRCRKQKLRCPANDENTQSCGRCLRAGIPCVTSYTRPKGRSQKHEIPVNNTRLESGPDEQTGQESVLPTPESFESATLTRSDQAAEDASVQSTFLFEEYDPLSSWSDFESSSLSQGKHESLMNLWDASPYRDFNSDIHVDASGASQDAHIEFASSLHSAGNLYPSGYSQEMLQEVECDMRLSELNLDLCRQLNMQLLRRTPTSGTLAQNACSDLSTAFRDVLRSTDAYIHLLQRLRDRTEPRPNSGCQATTAIPTPTTTTTHNYSDPGSPLTSICVLNLISCFFRIVDLFNIHLFNLTLEITTNAISPPLSSSSSSSNTAPTLQILSEFNLAGLPVHEVSLQIKLLVLAITHHLETMERLLGIPTELRVSQCQDDNVNGLLSANWTNMLGAGMTEQRELGWCGTGNWGRSVESLRTNIQRLIRAC
jgi:hypothetical protein